jgi:hypothetical protein
MHPYFHPNHIPYNLFTKFHLDVNFKDPGNTLNFSLYSQTEPSCFIRDSSSNMFSTSVGWNFFTSQDIQSTFPPLHPWQCLLFHQHKWTACFLRKDRSSLYFSSKCCSLFISITTWLCSHIHLSSSMNSSNNFTLYCLFMQKWPILYCSSHLKMLKMASPQVEGGIGPLGLVGPWARYWVFKTNKKDTVPS